MADRPFRPSLDIVESRSLSSLFLSLSPVLPSVHLGREKREREREPSRRSLSISPRSYPRYPLDVEEGWSPRGLSSPYEIPSYLLFLARAASRGGPPRPETFLSATPLSRRRGSSNTANLERTERYGFERG